MTQQPKYKVGDIVTLCPIEFDDDKYDGIWRIQFLKNNICFVTTLDEYVEVDLNNPPDKITVLPEHIEVAEIKLATHDEINLKCRSW